MAWVSRSCLFLIAGLLWVGPGCSYQRLRSEDSVEEFARLKAVAASVPARTTRVQVRPGVEVAVHESGTGDRDRVIVLLHGAISNSRAWRLMRGGLCRDFDLMWIDLPGCGESDKPDPEVVGDEFYSVPNLSRYALEAIRQRQAARPARAKVTLVSHCLGGAMALRMYGDDSIRNDFTDVLADIDSMVMIAGVDIAMETPSPAYVRVCNLKAWEAALGKALRVVREIMAASTLTSTVEPGLAVREEADRGVEILGTADTLAAAQAMLRQAVPMVSASPYRPDWGRIRTIVEGYGKVDVPCLLVWGEQDDYNPQSVGYKLAAQLPRAQLRIVKNTRHSIALERPAVMAGLIRQFAQTRGEGGPKVGTVDEAGRVEIAAGPAK